MQVRFGDRRFQTSARFLPEWWREEAENNLFVLCATRWITRQRLHEKAGIPVSGFVDREMVAGARNAPKTPLPDPPLSI
jgi:hypothetical protein